MAIDLTVPPQMVNYPDLIMKMRIEMIRAGGKKCSSCTANAIREKYIAIALQRTKMKRKKN